MKPCPCSEPHQRRRVVLTGGPGAGKTAVLELIRQAFCERVRVLYYVHPAVFETYLAGAMADALKNGTRKAAKRALADEEASVVRLLRHHLAGQAS